MATGCCPACGAAADPSSRFCTYCGTTLPGDAGPLPSSGASTAPGPFPAGSTAGVPGAMRPTPPRPSRTLVVVVILVVLFLVVGVIAFAGILTPALPVQVSAIFVYAPHNTCGLNLTPIYFPGFNSSKGANETLDFSMPNYNTSACVVHAAATNTSGFALYNVQAPVTIPGSSSASMNITIHAPSSSYSGVMSLVLT